MGRVRSFASQVSIAYEPGVFHALAFDADVTSSVVILFGSGEGFVAGGNAEKRQEAAKELYDHLISLDLHEEGPDLNTRETTIADWIDHPVGH